MPSYDPALAANMNMPAVVTPTPPTPADLPPGTQRACKHQGCTSKKLSNKCTYHRCKTHCQQQAKVVPGWECEVQSHRVVAGRTLLPPSFTLTTEASPREASLELPNMPTAGAESTGTLALASRGPSAPLISQAQPLCFSQMSPAWARQYQEQRQAAQDDRVQQQKAKDLELRMRQSVYFVVWTEVRWLITVTAENRAILTLAYRAISLLRLITVKAGARGRLCCSRTHKTCLRRMDYKISLPSTSMTGAPVLGFLPALTIFCRSQPMLDSSCVLVEQSAKILTRNLPKERTLRQLVVLIYALVLLPSVVLPEGPVISGRGLASLLTTRLKLCSRYQGRPPLRAHGQLRLIVPHHPRQSDSDSIVSQRTTCRLRPASLTYRVLAALHYR